jgi:hypothetical protein
MKSTEVLDRMNTMFRIEEMGISEIEGKGTMGSAEQGGSRASFNRFCFILLILSGPLRPLR